jgi:hypothetical protein
LWSSARCSSSNRIELRRVHSKRQIAGYVVTLRDLDEYFGGSIRVPGRNATAFTTPGEYLGVLLGDGPDGHRRPCPVDAKAGGTAATKGTTGTVDLAEGGNVVILTEHLRA